MCFKWQLVQAFLDESAQSLSSEHRDILRSKIRSNDLLDVDYDNATMRIKSMRCDAFEFPDPLAGPVETK